MSAAMFGIHDYGLFVLSAVLLVVTLSVRKSAREGVVDRLETARVLLGELEERRAQELRAQVTMLAENSTLKAAVDTYQSELRTTNPAGRQDLVATIARELAKVLGSRVIEGKDAEGNLIEPFSWDREKAVVAHCAEVARAVVDRRLERLAQGSPIAAANLEADRRVGDVGDANQADAGVANR